MKIKLSELMYQISFALDCVEKDLLKVSTHHAKRVAYLCLLIGRHLGMNEEEVLDLACAGILHDNALSEYILSESMRKHNDEIWQMNMVSHCILGEENVRTFPFCTDTKNFILYHHENADGSGPFLKTYDQIPLGAQIIRICDSLDSMFHLGDFAQDKFSVIRNHVIQEKGRMYSEKAAEAFLKVVTQETLLKLPENRLDEELNKITPKEEKEVEIDDLIDFSSVLARIVDYKSHFTKEHSYQIAQKSSKMAEFYGYSREETKQLYLAAALHDLGKLATPINILEKPGALTSEEFQIMKQHVAYTYEMLSKIKGLEKVNYWASSHHERLDGNGYPFGKKAQELDFNCRLLCCIDVYQALSEERPYRSGLTHEAAMKIIYEMANDGALEPSIVPDLDTVFNNRADRITQAG